MLAVDVDFRTDHMNEWLASRLRGDVMDLSSGLQIYTSS